MICLADVAIQILGPVLAFIDICNRLASNPNEQSWALYISSKSFYVQNLASVLINCVHVETGVYTTTNITHTYSNYLQARQKGITITAKRTGAMVGRTQGALTYQRNKS